MASSEPGSGPGAVQPEKRERLVAAGADLIVADYAAHDVLIPWLWDETP